MGRDVTVAFFEVLTLTIAPGVSFTSKMPWSAFGLLIQLCTTARSRLTVITCAPLAVMVGRTKLLPATTAVPWPRAPGVAQSWPVPRCSQPRFEPDAPLHEALT